MQELKVAIPEDLVLVSKDDYLELLKKDLHGEYYSIKDLARLMKKSESWVRMKMLNDPLVLERMREFTHVPKAKGDHWSFKAKELRDFLDTEFHNILRR